MKYTTIWEIQSLKNILAAKRDMIKAYEGMIFDIRVSYPTLSNDKLVEAISEVREMEKTIKAELAWCDKAEAEIARFFAPAA